MPLDIRTHRRPPKTAPFILCGKTDAVFEAQENDPTLYRKEIVYPDFFVKKTSDGDIEFELPVDEQLMDHWVATFAKMKRNGIEVPLPIEHTTDPEERRGTVEDLKKEYNPERQANSLYAYIRFRDKQTGDALSKTSQVSLFSPPDFVDGRGNRYVRPIQHVALTDYPLIPSLGKWEAVIAASLSNPRPIVLSDESITEDVSTEDIQMNSFLELAAELGVELPEGATEDDARAAIVDAWNVDEDGGELLEDPLADTDDFGEGVDDSSSEVSFGELPADDEEDLSMSDDPMAEEDDEELTLSDDPMAEEDDEELTLSDDPMAEEDDEELTLSDDPMAEEDDEELTLSDDPMVEEDDEESIPASFNRRRSVAASSLPSAVTREVVNAREVRLRDLARRRLITPAVCKQLERVYCDQSRVAFALSNSSGRDDFEAVVAALSHNTPRYSVRERTGAQQRGDGRLDGTSSPVVAEAERRAKVASNRRR